MIDEIKGAVKVDFIFIINFIAVQFEPTVLFNN